MIWASWLLCLLVGHRWAPVPMIPSAEWCTRCGAFTSGRVRSW